MLARITQHVVKGLMMKLSHIPLRLATGAFIFNAGYSKRNLDKDSAARLQGMGAKVYPQVARLEPEKFGKLLSYAEMTLGAILLAPFVPSRLAGLGLGIFSGSLLTMYRRIPEMTLEDGIRPSQQGTVLAKDIWMFGIALALILDRKGSPMRGAQRSTPGAARRPALR
ncbi:hypothetical protein ACFO0G_12520 [Arthrobacter sedimenti]|uniref:DoxX family membrane protein n=2 Tax=Micrococcales TaxID=85006 RepID=A0ABV8WJM7_9MICC